jgi:hypothetical protein
MTRGIRLQSLADVRRFLAKTINAFHRGAINAEQAKTTGYLCSILKDVIRESTLEQRIEALEREAGVK